MVKFIAVLTPVVFATLLTGWASAKESANRVAIRSFPAVGGHLVEPGRCWREVSFNETRDGSFVVRSAWVCEVPSEPRSAKQKCGHCERAEAPKKGK